MDESSYLIRELKRQTMSIPSYIIITMSKGRWPQGLLNNIFSLGPDRFSAHVMFLTLLTHHHKLFKCACTANSLIHLFSQFRLTLMKYSCAQKALVVKFQTTNKESNL